MPHRLIPAIVLAALAWQVPAAQAGPACAAPGPQVLWAAADVDGDDRVDLVRITVGRGAGGARVMPRVCVLTAPLLDSGPGGQLEIRDIDFDRDLDIVQVDALGTRLRAWANDGAGRFTPISPAADRSAPRSTWHVDGTPADLVNPLATSRGTAAAALPPAATAASPFDHAFAGASLPPQPPDGSRRGAGSPRGPPRLFPHA